MSTLDKAFIKAYQRHGVNGPHAAFGRRPLPMAADATNADSGNRPATVPRPHLPDIEKAAGEPPPEKEPISDSSPIAVIEPPVEREPLVKSDSAAAGDAGLALQTRIAHQPTATRSVSKEERPTQLANASLDDSVDYAECELRPAFEIEQFKWPAVVPALVDDRQSQLATLLDELLPLGQGGLAVGGCRRGEGRTTVAMIVARQLAQTGARVVLVDADAERPKLAETLGTAAEIGWSDALTNSQSAAEAMIESLADRLVILPLKRPVADATLVQHRHEMTRMLRNLQAAFDFVCFDLGPAVASRGWETTLFESGVRAAVVVRDVRHCRLEQAQAVGRKFAELGAAHWTIIENFV